MNILHIIAPVSFGGGESLLINLLKEKKHHLSESVALIYSSPIFEINLEKISIPYWVLRKKSIGQGISKSKIAIDTIITLSVLPQLITIIKKQKIHLIHAHGYPANVLFYIIKKITRVKGIYTHHFYRSNPSYIEQYLLSKVYSCFDGCVGVSNLVTQSMNSSFPQLKTKFITVYNCVGNDFYKNDNNAQDFINTFPPDKSIFVQVARFNNFKNQMLVVESLKKLNFSDQKQIFIVFAGEGYEKLKVIDFVKLNGLESQVCFLGEVPYEKIKSLLMAADFGLFPSENEGFGIAAAEYMAVGLPVLSLDTELMREIIGNAGLQIIRSDFHNGFRKIIENFSTNSGYEYARQRAEMFKPSLIKNQYYELYQNIIGRS